MGYATISCVYPLTTVKTCRRVCYFPTVAHFAFYAIKLVLLREIRLVHEITLLNLKYVLKMGKFRKKLTNEQTLQQRNEKILS